MSIKATSRPSSHPGRVLKTLMAMAEITQLELAKRIGVTQGKISEIISGKRGIAPEMACRLARVFSMRPETWLEMQDKWELAQINRKKFSKIRPLEKKKAA